MIVQCKQTGRELEMFYVMVPWFLFPEAETVLKRYTKGSDEKYEAIDIGLDATVKVIATVNHRNRIVSKLIQQECLSGYSDLY